ncbi:effector-associated domain 2-containing protein [Actinomadura scrupuli]|uniref:effector-associated domain 2-containing protein n=1 Tax=Actinomadura scrupuli TaxID=559629 RepID=UPI003D993609
MTDSSALVPPGDDEPSKREADGAAIFRFADALAALPSLRGSADRSAFTRLLRPEIAHAVRHDPRTRVYAFNLLMACLDHEGGLPDLLACLWWLEGDSLAMRRVAELAPTLRRRPRGGGAYE